MAHYILLFHFFRIKLTSTMDKLLTYNSPTKNSSMGMYTDQLYQYPHFSVVAAVLHGKNGFETGSFIILTSHGKLDGAREANCVKKVKSSWARFYQYHIPASTAAAAAATPSMPRLCCKRKTVCKPYNEWNTAVFTAA